MDETVESYKSMALRWWADPKNPHGETCPDLPCADVRKYLGRPGLPIVIGKRTFPTRSEQV